MLTSNQEVEGSRLHPPRTITISEGTGRLLDRTPVSVSPYYINADHWSSSWDASPTIESDIEPHFYSAMEAMDWRLSEAKVHFAQYIARITNKAWEPREDWWSYWK